MANSWLCIALPFILFLPHVDMVAIVMKCPRHFSDGGVNDVICDINTTDVSLTHCAATPTTVTFQLLPSTTTGVCTVSYTTTQCDTILQAGACGCTAINGSVKTFLFKYQGNKANTGANFACSVCATLEPTITVDYGHCANISFAEDSTTTTPAASTETTEDSTTTTPAASTKTSGAEKIQIGVCGHVTRVSVAVLYIGTVRLVRGFFM